MATPQSTREEEEAAALHALTSQYRQLVPPQTLHFPPPHLLSQEHFQDAIYHALFSPSTSPDTIPPQRYTARVLKALVAEIEASNPDEINSSLLSLYSTFPSSSAPPPTSRVPVTYTLPAPYPSITLHETPSLISGLGTTGLRTWEAALALSEYLLLHPPHGQRVLELGAGTGVVALVAARCGAEDVLATDGDEGVCDVLRENVGRNGLGGRVRVEQRQWGGKRDVPEDVQLVVGADVTYDAEAILWLVAELSFLLQENRECKVIIAATIRNEDTFQVFRDSCAEAKLALVESVYTLPEPRVFWYVPRAEIRLVEVSMMEK
ncbi:putative methyltransferase-domain-containing protein [Tricharina praecox]|uniref:putative methyltransferase-domain-containing protein n=1 Tax=Tricharina praecox TaxID=43433 RepID=UPI00221EA8AA|nr:putative methyltransferase-domain-containing protein [Tricharina praecox]KAI5858817.1 putative methyltransferase-domain-containing protein [Tricharina praecox]